MEKKMNMSFLPRIQASNLLPWRQSSGLHKNQENSPFSALQNEINRLFSGFGTGFAGESAFSGLGIGHSVYPAVDIIENEKQFKVEVELPGVKEADVEVDIGDNYLTIKGEKKRVVGEESDSFLCQEYFSGKYQRSIALPESSDTAKAKASFKEGVLVVEIPKKAGAATKTRKLEIKKAA